MTIDNWLEQFSEDDRETLCITDAWKAGAKAMIDALIDRGYIGWDYKDVAKNGVLDIIGDDEVLKVKPQTVELNPYEKEFDDNQFYYQIR